MSVILITCQAPTLSPTTNRTLSTFTPCTAALSPFEGSKALLQTAVNAYIDCTVNCDDPSTAHGVAFGHINTWCTAGITDMSYLFLNKETFNENIGGWNTSSVTNIFGMFGNARAFNQDIGGWDVSSVVNMQQTLSGAYAFNQNIGGWNVSSVTNMYGMFGNARAFNQDIGGWDVSSVTNMYSMFTYAYAFNQNLCGWAEHNFPYNNAGSIFSGTSCVDKSTPTDATDDFCQPCSN